MMRAHRVAGFALAVLTAQMLGTGLGRAADYDGPRHHYRQASGRAWIGECVHTRVASIGAVPGGASAPVIRFSDGVIQDYDSGMLGHIETRPGDPIQLCLVSFTRDCGTIIADEQPGRTYATGNLRTGAAWTLPDLRSSCAAH
jgi:hypothetical protein